MGDCVALSLNDVGERSYQGCSCDEPFPFVCESADETPDFDCPDDGFFPSAPCSDLWYNCWGGESYACQSHEILLVWFGRLGWDPDAWTLQFCGPRGGRMS